MLTTRVAGEISLTRSNNELLQFKFTGVDIINSINKKLTI